MGAIILHPEYSAKHERLAELRKLLSIRFEERIRLQFHTIPELRSAYNELFGTTEQQLQERTLEHAKKKRMVELLALKLDRGQQLDAEIIELTRIAVAREFGEITARASRLFKKRSTGPVPSTTGIPTSPRQRVAELRRLYLQLAKRLHPDVQSHQQSDETRRYWELLQLAQQNDDLDVMRALDHLTAISGTVRQDHEVVNGSNPETALKAAIRSEESRIEALRTQEPFTIADGLTDDVWINRRRAELQSQLDALNEQITTCDEFLDPIYRSINIDNPPKEQPQQVDINDTLYFTGR